MKKPTLTFVLFCFISIAYAQVGIGTIAPGNLSVADIDSNNATEPTVIVSNTSLEIESSNDNQWLYIPDLTATFTILKDDIVKIDWTLFTGQANPSSSSGFAQMFTILEVNGVNDVASSNYFPMVHNPGDNNHKLLMNTSKFSHAISLDAGTYTVRVKVLAATFFGSTKRVEIGPRIDNCAGIGNMTAQEKLNAVSNKLLIAF